MGETVAIDVCVSNAVSGEDQRTQSSLPTHGISYRGKKYPVSEAFFDALTAYLHAGRAKYPLRSFASLVRDRGEGMSKVEREVLADCMAGVIKPLTLKQKKQQFSNLTIFRTMRLIQHERNVGLRDAVKLFFEEVKTQQGLQRFLDSPSMNWSRENDSIRFIRKAAERDLVGVLDDAEDGEKREKSGECGGVDVIAWSGGGFTLLLHTGVP